MGIDLGLSAELARMAAEDQRIRTHPSDPTEFVRFLSVAERMEAARIDVANTDRLRAIIAEHGWPGRALVGDEGAEAAWLIAQHADHQLDFQREALVLLERAVHDGDAPASHLAYLTDRVRMNEGRPQLFGTQVADITNGVSPWPIEDEEHVDQRRANAGLESLADYLNNFTNASPWPIEDEEHVDQRRANAGLESLADYLNNFTNASPSAEP